MAIVWYDTRGAADYVGLAPQTLNKMRVYGGGPAFHKLGNLLVRYTQADLDAWLESRRRTSTSDQGLR